LNPERVMVVAERWMEPELVQVVGAAAARAGLDRRPWNGTERLDALAGRAALAVGVLPRGMRRIPGELAALACDQLPGLPLVLLADEPLVRPLVSLQEGRVTLIEATLSASRLASCVRALLADTLGARGERGRWRPVLAADARPGAIERCEFRAGPCWLGALACRGPSGVMPRAVPWLCATDELSIVLAPADAPPAEDEAGPLAALGLGEGASAAETSVRLDCRQEPGHWLLKGPGPQGALGLFSRLRLPSWSDLGRRDAPAGRAELRHRIAAASGDLVVALATGSRWADAAAARQELDVGGPDLLDLYEAELRRTPAPFACLLVELR
jgi:hypothetical protein